MGDVSGHIAGDSLLHGLAGGVFVPRFAAEHTGANHEERERCLGFGFGSVRVFAHYKHGISELAVRNPGVDRRIVLWVDVEADELHFCVGDRTRAGGCAVALSVSDTVTG